MKYLSRLSILSLALLAAACTEPKINPVDSMMGFKAQHEARLATAASEAIAAGRTADALLTYEKLYGKTPKNGEVVLNYAQLLRKSGRGRDAIRVLEPFAAGHKKTGNISAQEEKIAALLMNEYAAAQIENGDFATAEKVIENVLKNPRATAAHADARNLSGIALDAQGRHHDAEAMFRDALKTWKGDKSSVMNNLGLSLAAQGKFDEALDTLRRALLLAPGKGQIARNIELVTHLQTAIVAKAPIKLGATKPLKKRSQLLTAKPEKPPLQKRNG